MTNLKPHSYATFDLVKSEQIKIGAFFVILKHQDGIYSTGILIDNPIEKNEGGWYLFGEQKHKKELAAVIAFNKLCASIPVTVHG
ncbi:hypothetical protein [Nostoc sp. PA-18-2419]|uniref:hypothetical protein n=1 Tax=Nostoc sp. PA-18-2419 TaxID=2575443 RepID=UPI0011088A42|nr:hypothetical protein [Nostoc sp. PA-18-2419]